MADSTGSSDDAPSVSEQVSLPVTRRQLLAGGAAGGIGLVGVGFVRRRRNTSCGDGPVIQSPVRHDWMVLTPPGHQAEAIDLIGMREGRSLPYRARDGFRHIVGRLTVAETFGWNRRVYAPISGTVIEVENDVPDRTALWLSVDLIDTIVTPPAVTDDDIAPAAGNHLAIEGEEGVAFLAHLRAGSIDAGVGDEIEAGAYLGRVGNSGASAFPHIHIQLMHEWTTDLERLPGTLRPFRFDTYQRQTGGIVRPEDTERVDACLPRNRERFSVPRTHDGIEHRV